MNASELKILEQIENAFSKDDAAFAQRIANGPRLSGRYKAGLAAASLVGIALTMMFSMNLAFGVAGYLVLTGVGTNLLRRRAVKPIDETPLQFFHRLTAGLFENTGTVVEPSLD